MVLLLVMIKILKEQGLINHARNAITLGLNIHQDKCDRQMKAKQSSIHAPAAGTSFFTTLESCHFGLTSTGVWAFIYSLYCLTSTGVWAFIYSLYCVTSTGVWAFILVYSCPRCGHEFLHNT